MRQELTSAGLDVGNRKVILYAPTWKGVLLQRPALNVRELLDVVSELQGRVDGESTSCC